MMKRVLSGCIRNTHSSYGSGCAVDIAAAAALSVAWLLQWD